MLTLRSFAIASTSLLVACGGANETDLFGTPPSGNDGGVADTGIDVTPQPPDGSACGACGTPAPAGFHYVSYAEDRTSACPQGAATQDVLANPSDAVTCTCDCAVGAVDCNSGQITRPFDTGVQPTCNQQGATLNAAAPTCTVLSNPIQLATHIQVNAPAVTGACSSNGKPKPDTVKATLGRVCDAPPSCAGIVCGGPQRCVAQAGDVACPSSFSKKTLVGTNVAAKCEPCGACKAEVACTGTLTFFTDTACNTTGLAMNADSTCGNRPPQATGQTYQAYTYKGVVKTSTCTPPPDVKGVTSLEAPTTICCAK